MGSEQSSLNEEDGLQWPRPGIVINTANPNEDLRFGLRRENSGHLKRRRSLDDMESLKSLDEGSERDGKDVYDIDADICALVASILARRERQEEELEDELQCKSLPESIQSKSVHPQHQKTAPIKSPSSSLPTSGEARRNVDVPSGPEASPSSSPPKVLVEKKKTNLVKRLQDRRRRHSMMAMPSMSSSAPPFPGIPLNPAFPGIPLRTKEDFSTFEEAAAAATMAATAVGAAVAGEGEGGGTTKQRHHRRKSPFAGAMSPRPAPTWTAEEFLSLEALKSIDWEDKSTLGSSRRSSIINKIRWPSDVSMEQLEALQHLINPKVMENLQRIGEAFGPDSLSSSISKSPRLVLKPLKRSVSFAVGFGGESSADDQQIQMKRWTVGIDDDGEESEGVSQNAAKSSSSYTSSPTTSTSEQFSLKQLRTTSDSSSPGGESLSDQLFLKPQKYSDSLEGMSSSVYVI